MHLNCDVVMDLVSLYKDGLASPSSREAIREHLRDCPACRRYYRQYDLEKAAVPGEAAPAPAVDYAARYEAISLKLRRRRTFYIGFMACCAGAATAAILISAIKKSRD